MLQYEKIELKAYDLVSFDVYYKNKFITSIKYDVFCSKKHSLDLNCQKAVLRDYIKGNFWFPKLIAPIQEMVVECIEDYIDKKNKYSHYFETKTKEYNEILWERKIKEGSKDE